MACALQEQQGETGIIEIISRTTTTHGRRRVERCRTKFLFVPSRNVHYPDIILRCWPVHTIRCTIIARGGVC